MDLFEQHVEVDRELLLVFFLAFARLEFALKASGLGRARPHNRRNHIPNGPQLPGIEPDWRGFIDSIRGTFDSEATPELAAACTFLRANPPFHQVFHQHGPMFEPPEVVANEADVDYQVRMIKTVRNNLFHGGKFQIAPHEDVGRTEMLLRSSLVILGAFLDLAPTQRAAYLEARL